MQPSLRQQSASPRAQSVTVIIHCPALMRALWREKTSHAPLGAWNVLPSPPLSSSSALLPPLPQSHLPHPAHPLPISVNQSFMKSQGDTDSVVLVTTAIQLLPGHRAQTSPEHSEASVLQREEEGMKGEEIKGWREGRGWKVKQRLLQPSLAFI